MLFPLLLLLLPLLPSHSETWIVMDLMDRGNLAAAVRHSSMFIDDDGALNAVRQQATELMTNALQLYLSVTTAVLIRRACGLGACSNFSDIDLLPTHLLLLLPLRLLLHH
jgi:hypothetical protein